MKIIEPMKHSLQRAKFDSHCGFYYEVFIQKAGNGNNTILKNFSETEVEDIQALIKQN